MVVWPAAQPSAVPAVGTRSGRWDDHERARAQLHQLARLRVVAIVAQLAAVATAEGLLAIELPVLLMVAVLAALALFNAWTWRRLQLARPVTDAEMVAQLSVDMVALTLVLAMSGGASNPFAGLFLLPLALGASWLPWRQAWALAIESVLCYSLLLFMARPLLPAGEGEHPALLAAAMWLSYAITAAVLVSVLARIGLALRRGEQDMDDVRSRATSDEHLVRIGALAAGAAHELNAPLASVALIVDELRRGPPAQRDLHRSLETISRQLGSCRETLATLLCYGNSTFCSPADRLPADALVRSCLDSFAMRRPEAKLAFRVETAGRPPTVLSNRALCQALTSVLDNAADVSPRSIEVGISWDRESLRIQVRDRGPGIAADVMQGVGKLLFITTKERGKGNGLGLYLANTAVIRFGGALTLANAADGGAIVQIALPVAETFHVPARAG